MESLIRAADFMVTETLNCDEQDKRSVGSMPNAHKLGTSTRENRFLYMPQMSLHSDFDD